MRFRGGNRLGTGLLGQRGDAADVNEPIDGGGSNAGIFGPVVPIGGAFASGVGGYIDCWSDSVLLSLDVARWQVRRVFEYLSLCCSGNQGATDSRLVGYSYQWQAEILWDFRAPADAMGNLRWIGGSELIFWLGQILYQQMKVATPGTGDGPMYPYLWCPDAVLDVSETMLNAIDKKMTRVPCSGHARSHIFVCPAEGIPQQEETKAGAYNSWYQTYGPENQNAGG